MASILIYGAFMVLGCILGVRGFLKKKLLSKLEMIQEILVLFLIFVMGVGIGKDEHVMQYLFSLGFKAFIIASFSVVFSILFVNIYSRISKKIKGKKNDN